MYMHDTLSCMIIEEKKAIIEGLFKATPHTPSDQEIFQLALESKDDVLNFLVDNFFNAIPYADLGPRAGVLTRRVNKVWPRIKIARENIIKKGPPGIYKVERTFFNEPIAFIFAESYEDANRLVGLFFQYVFPDYVYLKPKFVAFGMPHDMLSYNASVLDSIDESVKSALRRIEITHKDIKHKYALREVIVTLQGQVIASLKD